MTLNAPLYISPLEQFNILSLADGSLSGGVESLFVGFLITIWSLVWNYPLTLVNWFCDTLALSFVLSSFLVLYHYLFTNFFSILLDPLTLIFSYFYLLYTLLDSLFSLYSSCFSYLWYFTLLDFSNSFLVFEPTVDFLTKTDIKLIGEKGGWFWVNIYFIMVEMALSIKIFVYNLVISKILNASLCDFSFLILSLNSSTLWLFLGISLVGFIFLATTWKNSITLVAKHHWQTLLESFYLVIYNVVNENAGPSGKKFFPLIFTTFGIILTCNVLGMIPYSFTVTSHLIVTFSTALAIFTGMNILGICKHGKHFLSLFFPPGAPLVLAPLLVLIEFISYVFRVLSLSIRLFANLMSGHTLLKILATFSWGLVNIWGLFLLPVTIIFIVTGLEMAIAFLQAYIFSVLLCIYLNDAFNLH